MKPEFSLQIFLKKTQISNFIKIRPVGGQLFHAPERHDDDNSRFPQFCKEASKLHILPHRIFFVCFKDLRIYSDYFPIQRRLTGF